MSYILHNDEPTTNDKLSRGALVTEISKIAGSCTPPQALGVNGDWGAGKTSILRQIQKVLSENPQFKHVVPIWFDAWQYQNETVPVVALLQQIRRQLNIFQKSHKQAKKIGEVTLRSILYGIDNITKMIQLEAMPFSAEKVQAIGERWEKEHLEDRLATDTIQRFLQEAIASLLPQWKGQYPPRLVIIIDDIDRCNPEAAYRLLEGLRNYLILNNCVFIVGMNQQVVIEAISKVIGSGKNHEVKLRAEAYLEKMCSHIWRLPFPEAPSKLLANWLSDEAKEVGDAAIKAEVSNKFLFLPPNPRRLKSLANLLNRMWAAYKINNEGVNINDEKKLCALVVAYTYQFHSEMYQRWCYDPDFFYEIISWVKSSKNDPVDDQFFEGLLLPTVLKPIEGSPTPVHECSCLYPNPVTPGIFWIAPLLQNVLNQLTPEDFKDLINFEASK